MSESERDAMRRLWPSDPPRTLWRGRAPADRLYSGQRYQGEASVHASDRRGDKPLNPRLDLRNHSPTGLEWGYAGSGPAQLALALIADATGDDALALEVYQDFKFRHVATFERGGWTMSAGEVAEIAVELSVQRRAAK